MQIKKQEKIRDKTISVKLDQKEYELLGRRLAASTHRSKASYIRDVALGEPIVLRTRSASHDELYELLSEVRADLKSVSGSFDKAASAIKVLPESGNYENLLIVFEMERRRLTRAIDRIGEQIMKIASVWL